MPTGKKLSTFYPQSYPQVYLSTVYPHYPHIHILSTGFVDNFPPTYPHFIHSLPTTLSTEISKLSTTQPTVQKVGLIFHITLPENGEIFINQKNKPAILYSIGKARRNESI